MGLSVMIAGPCSVPRRALWHDAARSARAADRVLRRGPYKIGFSLISAAGVALIVWGFCNYRATGWIDVWYPPRVMKHIAEALILPAVILVVASYIRGRIYTKLKHPMLAGVKLWAAAHLLANGDLGSIICSARFLAWAVIDRISLKRRADAGGLPIPVGGVRNDVIAVVVGLVVYLALGALFHPYVDRCSRLWSIACQSSRPSSAGPLPIFALARTAIRS